VIPLFFSINTPSILPGPRAPQGNMVPRGLFSQTLGEGHSVPIVFFLTNNLVNFFPCSRFALWSQNYSFLDPSGLLLGPLPHCRTPSLPTILTNHMVLMSCCAHPNEALVISPPSTNPESFKSLWNLLFFYVSSPLSPVLLYSFLHFHLFGPIALQLRERYFQFYLRGILHALFSSFSSPFPPHVFPYYFSK